MQRALVLGVNGQDGSYLAELLVRRGYLVSGIGRQLQSRYTPVGPLFYYTNLDLADREALGAFVSDFQPHVAFRLAAVHGSSGYAYEQIFGDMMKVNTDALHVLLEYARLVNPKLRIIYASSSKIFLTPMSAKSAKGRLTARHVSIASARSQVLNLYHTIGVITGYWDPT